jgi:hypothetical protein
MVPLLFCARWGFEELAADFGLKPLLLMRCSYVSRNVALTGHETLHNRKVYIRIL